ncbi:MAG TPA: LamG-like jellyroll fold domain-containing protein, partial [Armatimonadota bacterium]|nr:LamG-like jellyroll fold domain-containing protein [Armatimonadota bacterium]
MNATVLGLLVGAISACAQPEPLVELTFDAGLQNRGTLGSEAQFEEYVAEEGPSFTLGRAGAAVTFEASSRSGGTTTTKAGGAVVYTDPGISGLQEFTVSLWVFPISTEGPARLAYLASEWDFMMSNLMPSFKVTTGGQDHFLQPDRDAPRLDLDAWSFLAISVDAGAGTAVLYLGTETDAPTPIAKWEDVPPIDAASGRLEIGNLGGIRPFRGRIDTVRIHGAALSED